MKQSHGKIYLFLAFVLAGTSVIAARLVSDYLGSFTITAVSLLLGLVVLVPLHGLRLILAMRQMTATDWTMVILQAFFGIFLFRALLLGGLNLTSAGEAGLLTGAAPAITAVLAWLILKERSTAGILAGILTTVVGIVLIQRVPSSGGLLSMSHLGGNLLVVAAAGSESLFNILSRAGSQRRSNKETPGVDPVVQTTLVTIAAFALSIVPACLEHPISSLSSIGVTGWLALVWYGWIVTGLAFICWYAGIKRTSAYTAAAYSGLMPLTSLVLSVCVLGEPVSIVQALGGGAVIFGMVCIGRAPKNSSHPAKGSEGALVP